MSLFGTSALNAHIEKATNENNTTEKWDILMEVCDKVTNGAITPKECLKAIIKRLNHSNPHVVMQAITLLDACVNNCGKQFHLEVASREFETEFKKLLQKSQPKVSTKLKLCLKRWAEGDFKSDSQLDLIPSLYHKLQTEGHDFTDPAVTPKREVVLSKDPNVVSSQQEEDDIAKAIELSLKEAKNSHSPKMTAATTSLYPSTLLSAAPVPEPRKVRALYDFEAAEDNELTFQAGEIIMVLDDTDPNWWKGQNQRGEGLFPANFVTADLSVEPESLTSSKSKKSVQFSDEQKLDSNDKEAQKEQVAEINEEKIDRLLHLLHEANPEDPSQDTEEMLRLEQMVNQMGPLIDAELERVDRKHAQLTQLSSDLVEAMNLYHNLMRESDRSMVMGGPMGSGYPMGGYPGVMPGMYNMQGMYAPGMFPMPGQQPTSMPGPSMPSYTMSQLRHDIGHMSMGPIPQFPPPGAPQHSMHHLPQQAPPASQQAIASISQNGPNSLPHQMPPTTSMALGGNVQPPQVIPPQSSMPNMQVPQMNGPMQTMPMGSVQSTIPQTFATPASPPAVSNLQGSVTVPSTSQPQPQAQPPHQSQPPQIRPAQAAPPPVSYPNYPPQQQQQQPQPSVPSVAGIAAALPPGLTQHSQITAPVQPINTMAPPQSNMTHMSQHFPPQTGPFLQMGPPVPNFPMGPMSMLPPGAPLSINTAQSPQNIPIYQQQR